MSVEGAILQSPLLDDEEKAALVAVCQVFVDRSASSGPRAERARPQAVRTRPTGAGPRTAAGNGG